MLKDGKIWMAKAGDRDLYILPKMNSFFPFCFYYTTKTVEIFSVFSCCLEHKEMAPHYCSAVKYTC